MMSSFRYWILALPSLILAASSLSAFASTLVGNPEFTARLLDLPFGVQMPLATVELDDCEGGVVTLPFMLDLDAPSPLPLPHGTWCSISLVLADAIVVQ